jgi:hypothetical protein
VRGGTSVREKESERERRLVITFCINSARERGGHEPPRWIKALGKGDGRTNRTFGSFFFEEFDKGLRGGSGPQRLIRALGEETGNPIMAFHRPSFSPSFERAPHHTTTANPLRVVILRLNSCVVGFSTIFLMVR